MFTMVNRKVNFCVFSEISERMKGVCAVSAGGFVSFIVHVVNIPYPGGKSKGGPCENFLVGWVVYKKI